MDEVELWTSDLDYYPVLEALVNTRVRSTLRFDPRSTSSELPSYVDVAKPFTLREYLSTVGGKIESDNHVNWHSGNCTPQSSDTEYSRGLFLGKSAIHYKSPKMNYTTGAVDHHVDSIFVEAVDQTAILTKQCLHPKFVVGENLYDRYNSKIEWDE